MLGTHFEALKSSVTKVAVVVREPKRISENTYILQVRNVPALRTLVIVHIQEKLLATLSMDLSFIMIIRICRLMS